MADTGCQFGLYSLAASKKDHPKMFKYLIALTNRLEVGRWSFGRPVFRKVGGDPRFLFVQNTDTDTESDSPVNTWAVSKILSGQLSSDQDWLIFSGRATNDPTLREAAPSARFNRSRWSYWDGSASKEQQGSNQPNTRPETKDDKSLGGTFFSFRDLAHSGLTS